MPDVGGKATAKAGPGRELPRRSRTLYALRVAGDSRPGYRLIADQMATRIAAGEWALQSKLPGKSALAAEYGVATTTIERAMKVLAEQGYVQPVRSAGTYVVNRQPVGAPRPAPPLAAVNERLDRLEADVAAIKRHLGIG